MMVTYPATIDSTNHDRKQYLPAQRVAEIFRNIRKEDIETLGQWSTSAPHPPVPGSEWCPPAVVIDLRLGRDGGPDRVDVM